MVDRNTETSLIVGPGLKEKSGISGLDDLEGKRSESEEKWFNKVRGFQQRSDLGPCRNTF